MTFTQKPNKTKILDFILIHLNTIERNISKDWYKTTKYILFNFFQYCEKQKLLFLEDITIQQLEEYRNLRLSFNKKNTVKTVFATLSNLFNRAVKYELIKNNPIKKLDPLRGILNNKTRFLSTDEVKKVIEACKGNYFENLVTTAIYTGMRRRELIHLEYKDIDLEKKLIYIKNKDNFRTKSGKERIIPLHDKLVSMFEEKKEGTCFTYTYYQKSNNIYHKKNIIQEDTLSRNFKNVVKKVGLIDVGIHTLRHTFASHHAMNGTPIWLIAQWLGHSTTYITELYAHLCPDHSKKEINKINFATP
ncbi:MAG: site-specific integrase [Candidatus Jettenia sp.]|uniref:Putative phage integrase n=1 Tax=Candidatus Jettenia caeni TaxID=247490 RepID=I3IN35_9BACT|nr:site-specific integrase [Candidatus Jettenia sp. AMX1]MBC6928013.1 site-specific integrase [Candidatus Jettenia sp.]NUN24677.1 site-specific integrase [Candidatus Jettenia caeni]KAA0251113.1 MAG: site-specific integrase [Candidatus Jettenia sp. AMX1]MCQ3927428.1 site-specific integrase [Candidatus Jettenia sp.]MDL1937971.1 site-specific integrase [Candidatus Jettenia sp. AMX1]